MDIAVVQCEPRLADPAATRRHLEPLLERAAGADLVVLPELCNSGYLLETRVRTQEQAEELDGAGPFQTFLRDSCRRFRLGAVATGICERDGERLYNSAILLDEASVHSRYRKLHLFDEEKELFEPGDLPLEPVDLHGVRIGLLVCFDWYFPEAWRTFALRGADLIAHPSNLVLPGRCQRGVPVHAMLNRMFVATANRVGNEGSHRFTGESLLVDPSGEVLARGPAAEVAVLRAEIDPARARDKQVTARNDVLADRRPEFYEI